MRVFRLILLGFLTYVVSVLFLFPIAPLVKYIEPQIAPIMLTGVDGQVLRGKIDTVSYDDGAFIGQLDNVTWKVAPQKLLSLAAGIDFTFEAYGGLGQGEFSYRYNGDMDIDDVVFDGPAKGFEELLPLPIAQFDGNIEIDIGEVEIRSEMLTLFRGTIAWNDAKLDAPIPASFGNITLDIKPLDEQTHRGFLEAVGGEVEISGSVDLKLNGDFLSDLTVTPKSEARPELLNALRGLGRADSSGRYRVKGAGNVNRFNINNFSQP